MSLLFSYEQYMSRAVFDRLKEAHTWILGRVWPAGHDYLRATIAAMALVLNDLLLNFENHMIEREIEPEMLQTEKFYKISYWSPEDYEKLSIRWEFHCALVEDLCFELTRYGNLIANIVRDDIDSDYRFEQGMLLIRYGVDLIWRDTTYRPEFSPEQIADQRQPYSNLEAFLSDRPTRAHSEAKLGNSRGPDRPDPTKFPK
jgi:hypothetical protein